MSKPSATHIIDQMYNNDAFSQWLGIERLEEKEGYAKIRMIIRPEMTNGFNVAHGGITFSFADSAFAFASNSRGRHAVSIETSISHTKAVYIDDTLIAEAIEEHLSYKTAIYKVIVTNQNKEIVALFKGTVYRKSQEWQ